MKKLLIIGTLLCNIPFIHATRYYSYGHQDPAYGIFAFFLAIFVFGIFIALKLAFTSDPEYIQLENVNNDEVYVKSYRHEEKQDVNFYITHPLWVCLKNTTDKILYDATVRVEYENNNKIKCIEYLLFDRGQTAKSFDMPLDFQILIDIKVVNYKFQN